jgi:hypothetical protein
LNERSRPGRPGQTRITLSTHKEESCVGTGRFNGSVGSQDFEAASPNDRPTAFAYGAFMEPSGRNRWQPLANGRTPRSPERPAHADALTLLRAAVEAGNVSLPLSHVHYQETSHRKPFAKRVQLAKLMAELSRSNQSRPSTSSRSRRCGTSSPATSRRRSPRRIHRPPLDEAVTTPSAIRRSTAGSKL